MAEFLNLFEDNPQIVSVEFSQYPEVFNRATITIDPVLQKTLQVGVITESDITDPTGIKQVRQLKMSLGEGEQDIEVVLSKQTAKALIILMQQMFKNL